MTTNNNYNFGLLTNSSTIKTISFTVTITPSNSFTISQLPADYTIDYYYTGDGANQQISGIEIINKNNKPFLLIPNTQIAEYINNSAVIVSNLREIVQSVYPEGMVAVGEGQLYVLTSAFSLSSGFYPFPFTFYIID